MKKKIITDITYLRQKSEEVSLEEVGNIVKDLEDSLTGQRGIGLSAVQIGILKRVAIIRIPNKEPINLINPIIIEKEGKFRVKNEGCLSIPGLYVDTARYKQILVDNSGEIFVSYGLESVAIQHELSHLCGRTILDDKWRKRR